MLNTILDTMSYFISNSDSTTECFQKFRKYLNIYRNKVFKYFVLVSALKLNEILIEERTFRLQLLPQFITKVIANIH